MDSRYFVSPLNACKIIYLRHATINYLKYTGKDTGNKLEREVLLKLQNTVELSHLIIDGLMYYHIYGDFYMLSKLRVGFVSLFNKLSLLGVIYIPVRSYDGS